MAAKVIKFDDLEVISTPPGRTKHICWSCMKTKTIFVSEEDYTVYSLWPCCEGRYPQLENSYPQPVQMELL